MLQDKFIFFYFIITNFEDTKRAIKNRQSKDSQCNSQKKKKDNMTTMNYKTLHRTDWEHEPYKKKTVECWRF